MEALFLADPSDEYRQSFLHAIDEYRSAGESVYADLYSPAEADFSAYLRMIGDAARGIGLPENWVPTSSFWLVNPEREVLGVLRLRHHLTPRLEMLGGHIGYDIVPSQRGKGYGKLLLKLGLEKARKIGLSRVMLTCEPNNERSKHVIEGNGGVFLDEVPQADTGKPLSRFWINLEDDGQPRS